MPTSSSGSLMTYMMGVLGGSGTPLNMYLNAGIPVSSSGLVPMVITGSTSGTTYSYNTIPLYIKGDKQTSSLYMTITGSTVLASGSAYMNLFIGGRGEPVHNTVSLIISGSGTDVSSSGLSLEPLIPDDIDDLSLDELDDLLIGGSNVFSTSTYMNMYIGTGSQAQNNVPMFIKGNIPNQANIPLTMNGILGSQSGSINMYMNSKGLENNNVNLFIRGFSNTRLTSLSNSSSLSSMSLDGLVGTTLTSLESLEL